ncbi:hypothetical protein [Xanthocytophaga agilis]|uniref:Uncharacterized protein n=1 Tax=Xanthocytophaga agilis TaxID=3048010 RepID=A0AAE3R3R0_9BACT|nr:hypothetical protein [Xanthocytophaga agilis]MDJ1500814.1 hypothetical protein [Xanthocytophaga agilis]
MKVIQIVLCITILAIWACSSDEKKEQSISKPPVAIEKRVDFSPSPADSLLTQLRPAKQTFQVKADTDQAITGKYGTFVFIPENSFVDASGHPVIGQVDIELVEVFSAGDFVSSRLQTISNGKLLQSEGMLYIDAKANGQSVTLAPDKQLRIELPILAKASGTSQTKIFSGTYDTRGNMNWEETGKLDNKLIPLPLEVFDYTYWTSYTVVSSNRDSSWYSIYDYNSGPDSTTFLNSKLQNTFIATREFEERFWYITAIGNRSTIHNTLDEHEEKIVWDPTIANAYLNNLDKDLWYCDSLAYIIIKSWAKKTNSHKYWYWNIQSADLEKKFEDFYKQRLTKVIDFAGVDPSKKDARQRLKKKGKTPKEIDEIMNAYTRQQQLITNHKNKQEAQKITQNSFVVAKLGWINCDQFYNDPKAKEANILASIHAPNSLGSSVSAVLILDDRHIALSGSNTKDSLYRFTGSSAPYTKLPIGEKATIIALAYQNKQPYMGMKPITISENGTYEINLKKSSTKEIQETLKNLK